MDRRKVKMARVGRMAKAAGMAWMGLAGCGMWSQAAWASVWPAQQGGQGQQAAPTQPAAPGQQSPGQQAAPAKPAAPANDNAFPEEQSQAAEKEANAGDASASDGPATTPGENGGSSSSRSRMKGVDLLGDHDSEASNGAGGVVNDPKLAAEDIRIGQLYMGSGNFAGAYSRFKEATEVGPGNVDAVFYLAEAARKTAHLDEAAENYKLYLDAEPKGKRSKDAKKALGELAGK
ncbi:tetratricopeptide repeat protein [Acidipila sp. EB88]|uniref:tetratricopeptide repeat protein n=1 Tax=Acidipila sp. EB88 TaxID=2305226 RepID=UPI000FC1A152|nr:tetratricopeptide repeat protein [Acidipila sp. EB88]RRA49406.1 hypothetical protein D1Y84_15080 [Acidipila sp. EB88]